MSLVDKRRLTEALNLNGKKLSTFNFAFSHPLEEDVLESLCISGIGVIPVPISLVVGFVGLSKEDLHLK